MTPNKPYLLRALYEWILDNGLTPHLIVDVHDENVVAPRQAMQDGKLVLNISPSATRGLELGNDSVSFQARFSGTPFDIWLPIDAVLAIYARENGQGMMFARETPEEYTSKPDDEAGKPEKPAGPHLKLIK